MKTRYNQFNWKRRILKPNADELARLGGLAKLASYGGNPEHKRNPGDFGLTPPSDPRRAKSLCDAANVFSRTVARSLLRRALQKGLVSDRTVGGWPKNVWAVTETGMPLEAQLENPELGTYHGYPMPDSDPLANEGVRRWEDAHE